MINMSLISLNYLELKIFYLFMSVDNVIIIILLCIIMFFFCYVYCDIMSYSNVNVLFCFIHMMCCYRTLFCGFFGYKMIVFGKDHGPVVICIVSFIVTGGVSCNIHWRACFRDFLGGIMQEKVRVIRCVSMSRGLGCIVGVKVGCIAGTLLFRCLLCCLIFLYCFLIHFYCFCCFYLNSQQFYYIQNNYYSTQMLYINSYWSYFIIITIHQNNFMIII